MLNSNTRKVALSLAVVASVSLLGACGRQARKQRRVRGHERKKQRGMDT